MAHSLGISDGSAADEAPGASKLLVAFIAVLIAVGTFLYFYGFFGKLFILTEAREFFLSGRQLSDVSLGEFVLFPQGTNARQASVLLLSLIGQYCGVDVACSNASQAALLALCAAVLFVHGVQVIRSVSLAALAVVLWCLSAPVLNTYFWQATQHDKLAALVYAITAIYWWHMLNKRMIGVAGAFIFIFVSVALICIAFNAKEITFFLPVLLLIFAVSRGAPDIARVKRNITLAIIPVFYSGWYIYYYFARISGWWSPHVEGGDPVAGSRTLWQLSLGFGNFMNLGRGGLLSDRALMLAALLFWAALLVFLLIVFNAAKKASLPALSGVKDGLAQIRRFESEGYLFFIAVACTLITARTLHPSAYYMIIPHWAAVSLALYIAWTWSRPVFLGRALAGLFTLLFTGGLLVSYSTHMMPMGAAFRLMAASRTLEDSAEAMREKLAGRPVATLDLFLPEHVDGDWYLYFQADTKVKHFIGPYLLGVSQRPQVNVHHYAGVAPDITTLGGPQEAAIVIDSQNRIVRATYDGQELLTTTP